MGMIKISDSRKTSQTTLKDLKVGEVFLFNENNDNIFMKATYEENIASSEEGFCLVLGLKTGIIEGIWESTKVFPINCECRII